MIQIVSTLGSLMILAAYAASQAGKLGAFTRPYLLLNLVGSFILSIIAVVEQQWGFLLLEGVWTLVSAYSLWRLLSGRVSPDGFSQSHGS